jgi:hypothetical protein
MLNIHNRDGRLQGKGTASVHYVLDGGKKLILNGKLFN